MSLICATFSGDCSIIVASGRAVKRFLVVIKARNAPILVDVRGSGYYVLLKCFLGIIHVDAVMSGCVFFVCGHCTK